MHSEDSITVIVAKDSDPLLLTNRRQHSIDNLNHPGNRRRLPELRIAALTNSSLGTKDRARQLMNSIVPIAEPKTNSVGVAIELPFGQ